MVFQEAVDHLLFGMTNQFDVLMTGYRKLNLLEESAALDETVIASIVSDASSATAASSACEWNDVDASIISLTHLRGHALRGPVSSRRSSQLPSSRREKTKKGTIEKSSTPKTIAFIPIPKQLPKDEGEKLKHSRVPLPSAEQANGDYEVSERSKIRHALPECQEKDRRGSVSSKTSYESPVKSGEKKKEGGTEKPSTPKTIAFIPIPKYLPKDETQDFKPCKVPLPAKEARGDNETKRSKIPEHNPEIDEMPVPKVVFFDNILNTFEEQMMHLFCGNKCQGVMDAITAFDKSFGGYLTTMDDMIANETSKTTVKSPSETFCLGSSNSSMGRRDESASYFPKMCDWGGPGAVIEGGSPSPVNDGDGPCPANDGGIRDAVNDLDNRGPVNGGCGHGPVNDLDSRGPVHDLDSRGPVSEDDSRGRVNDFDIRAPVHETGSRGPVNFKPPNSPPLNSGNKTRKRRNILSRTPKRNVNKEYKYVSKVYGTIKEPLRVPLPSDEKRDEKAIIGILKRRRSGAENDTIKAVGGTVGSAESLPVGNGSRRSPYLITRERSRTGSRSSNQTRSSDSSRRTSRSKNFVTKASCGVPSVVNVS